MNEYLKNADSAWFKFRLTVAMFGVMAAFALLISRLFYLQVVEGEEFRRISETNCIRLQTTDAPRGLIFDRNGELLADNRPSFDLSIMLKDAKPLDRTVERLSVCSGIPKAELMSKISVNRGIPSYKSIILKEDISRELLAAVEANMYDLPGVSVEIRSRRLYPNKQSAAHLIGYVAKINAEELKSGRYPEYSGNDLVGKYGVEKSYDELLRGKRGGRQVEVNAAGHVIRVLKNVDSQAGHNFYLSIDMRLQRRAEELIDGRGASSIVAIEPRSGQILAMANHPSYDPNSFVTGMSRNDWNELISNPFRPLENKAIQGRYPPASTYKVITAIAALEEGIINQWTTYDCPGYFMFGDRKFRCWQKWGHGTVNVVDALAESCDVFFYNVGQRLGPDRLAEYAKAFGLGEPTGVKLDHEARGIVPSTAWKKKVLGQGWHKKDTISVSIGQGYNLATPLQMAVAISAIANNGIKFTPSIIKSVHTPDGNPVYTGEGPDSGAGMTKIPVSRRTLDIVKKGLWKVMNDPIGTAWQYRGDGVDVCGKTGTAQVIASKGDEQKYDADHHKPHAWFIGYDGGSAPKIAVAVIVENGEHGAEVAAPIARDLIRFYLNSSKKEVASVWDKDESFN